MTTGVASPPSGTAPLGSCLIGLLAVTGLRPCEAIGLNVGDLDVKRGLLHVTGKYGKQRLVPLHPSSIQALSGYLTTRSAIQPFFRLWQALRDDGR